MTRTNGRRVRDGDAWRAGALLRPVHQRMHRTIDLALAPLGTSMSQYVVLLAVEEVKGASAHELAVRTYQTDQSIGALLRRLVESGLVERDAGPGRIHRHRLSEAGRRLVERCEEPVRTALESEFAALEAAEVRQLRALLEKL
jgi:DNA-binding MarR family transcriptional regulator